jgi:hypothetical protein
MKRRTASLHSPQGTQRTQRSTRRGPCLLSVFALLVTLSGCAHAQAKTIAGGPALDVPAPPPRTVEPEPIASTPIDGVAPVSSPSDPAGAAADPARNAAPRPPAQAARPAVAPRVDEPVPVDNVKAPPAPPPAQTLQTTPAEQDGEVEGRIRTVLSRAGSDLNRIDYARLNANAKSQYDQAKRFVSLAEEAIRAKNLVYAGTLADKAAELAAQLPGR